MKLLSQFGFAETRNFCFVFEEFVVVVDVVVVVVVAKTFEMEINLFSFFGFFVDIVFVIVVVGFVCI
jgi:hypothetical protein